jgi:hypothetical protein
LPSAKRIQPSFPASSPSRQLPNLPPSAPRHFLLPQPHTRQKPELPFSSLSAAAAHRVISAGLHQATQQQPIPFTASTPHPLTLSQQAAALCQTDENQALSRASLVESQLLPSSSLPHTRPSWPLQLKQPVFSSKNRDRPLPVQQHRLPPTELVTAASSPAPSPQQLQICPFLSCSTAVIISQLLHPKLLPQQPLLRRFLQQ